MTVTRILITTIPIEGHVRPAIPVANHLTSEGHEVVWYTGRKFESIVTRTGASFVPVGADIGYEESDVDVLNRMEDKKPGISGLKKIVTDLFIAPIPQYIVDLTPLFESFNPDVVMADHCFMAGPLMAAKRGIPRVLFSVGPLSVSSVDTAPFGMALQPSSSWLGRLRNLALHRLVSGIIFRDAQRMALAVMNDVGIDPPQGFLMDWGVQIADRYLLSSIPEFEYPRSDQPEAVEFVGPMLPLGTGNWSAPAWWPQVAQAREAGRPVVLVTQGTANIDPALLILPAIAALADRDMLVVVTTGGPPPTEVMPESQRPANVRIESFIPYTELLPMTDVMITNGGYGGVQMALAWGVPLVVAGMGEDKMEVNARVAWSGAGISLKTHRPSPGKIREAVDSVLTDQSCRARAAELKVAYSHYSGASQAAGIVVDAGRGNGPARLRGAAESAAHRPRYLPPANDSRDIRSHLGDLPGTG